ncbi:MAG: glycoside hydrolase family 1 protein [Candidatus Andersenbacteria bacterium]|nr:glycoside hydrolase family 1 protein [Candidatus Andersenbacteria bacterium]MBI3251155.1 glycoside hydrolase family 1 protein [Candidatus Andersenbacteria bacterium]
MSLPSQFLIGAATSSHQVEGNNIYNDWWEWEQSRPDIGNSGRATDHWNKYKEDFALAKQLGHTAHRFSIEWSRIEPKPGAFNRKAIEHYREVLEELRRLNIKSFVTLHHFTNPVWLAKKGGWENGYAVDRFEKYVRYVAQHLGHLVDFWVTINEPMVYASQSYWRADWPPQKRTLRGMLRVIRNMAYGHMIAYRVLHSITPDTPVGLAKHLIAYLPEHRRQLDDQIMAGLEDWWFNHRFFSLTGNTHDFIGVNYYFTTKLRVKLFPPRFMKVPWEGAVSDINWPIRPEGLTHVLLHMKKYNLPIYITENGLADASDSKRSEFIRSHIKAVKKAMQQGVNVRGYLHWSLLDNFEWADGFKPRFGLIAVDYKTLERKIRPSAYVLKAFADSANI